jgi:hypothetical protein
MPSGNTAECIHDELKPIPLLTAGEISPLILHQWEMACEDYFSVSKKLEVVNRVATILPGLKDLRTCNWVATHRVHLMTLSFDAFMIKICHEFLTEGWDDELHAKICSSRLKMSDSFMSWLNELCHLNIVLRGTDYHFNDDALRLQLDSLVDTDLRSHAKNCRIKESIDAAINNKGEKTVEAHLSTWVTEMCKLADECANDMKCYKEAAESLHRGPKQESVEDGNRATKHPMLSGPSRIANTSQNAACTHPPKLTDNEHALLDKHQGCTKCRRGYQNHRAGDETTLRLHTKTHIFISFFFLLIPSDIVPPSFQSIRLLKQHSRRFVPSLRLSHFAKTFAHLHASSHFIPASLEISSYPISSLL